MQQMPESGISLSLWNQWPCIPKASNLWNLTDGLSVTITDLRNYGQASLGKAAVETTGGRLPRVAPLQNTNIVSASSCSQGQNLKRSESLVSVAWQSLLSPIYDQRILAAQQSTPYSLNLSYLPTEGSINKAIASASWEWFPYSFP